jgi:hypothetical protein
LRLVRLAETAFENSTDSKLTLRMRESWNQRYTNTVLALNQLLRYSQYKDYEKRLRVIEESARVLRRTVLPRLKMKRPADSTARKDELLQHSQTSQGWRSA